ncbi:integrase, catalytic region, zinc finger, CCHC-type containing protein [Tanacetum coccineum]
MTKLEFPKFSREDVKGWLFRCQQFFKVDNVSDEEKVRLASIHLYEKALTWHRQFEKINGDLVTWEVYEEEIYKRFGPYYEDPMEEIKNLRQNGTVPDYQDQFEALMFRPKSLYDAYQLARIQETVKAINTKRYTLILSTPNHPVNTAYINRSITYHAKSPTTQLALPSTPYTKPVNVVNTLQRNSCHRKIVGAENRPPMLDNAMYNSWESQDGQIQKKKYVELTEQEQLQDDCDVQATNIVLQGLPPDVYALVNTKFLNGLLSKWSKFVTDVKLAKNMYTTNYDQLYAYLSQYEGHANVRMMRERYLDPLALVANYQIQPNSAQYPQQLSSTPQTTHSSQPYSSIYETSHHPQLYQQGFQPQISHSTPSVPHNAYHSPTILPQPQVEFPQLNSGLAVMVFLPGDDPIACLNKAMAFMSTVVASRRQSQSFAGTGTKGNATSSGGNNAAGKARVVKCYNCQGEGHMARQCTQPKRPMNAAWFKEKMLLTQAQESSQVLNEEKLAFLANPGITYYCDDISSKKAVLMANLSSYGSDILFEMQNTIVQDSNSPAQQDVMIMSVFQQMSEKMSYHVTNWDKANQETKIINESLTAKLERYKERVKTFEQRVNVDLSSHEKLIDSQINDMIRNRCSLKQEIDSLKQTLSNQSKEKESLLQTFNVFKKESKEKENKYMDKEIDLEKKIKELDSIVYKGKAQRIKPTLYDGSVISKKHDVISVVDEEETLILVNIVMYVDSVSINVLPANNKCLVHDNLKIERLEQENDQLFELLLSQYIVHIYENSLATLTNYAKIDQDYIDEYCENLVLRAELAKKEHMIEKKFFDEVVLRCSRLENHCVNLKLKLQHQKESFLNNKSLNNQDAHEIHEFFNINECQAKLNAKDVSIANFRKHIESLKGKNVVEKDLSPNKAQVIAPGMFKLDLEPLSLKVLKNRDAHMDYIKHNQENADILWELVEHARAIRPLDSDLDSKYAKRIQEVLVYVTATCPSLTKPSEKLVAITPLKKSKKVRFTEHATSSSSTQK